MISEHTWRRSDSSKAGSVTAMAAMTQWFISSSIVKSSSRSAQIRKSQQLEKAGCGTIVEEESRGLLLIRRIL